MTSRYYCSQKFDWLEIRLYDGYVASCCKAQPSRLTKSLLEQNSRGFFNWPIIVQERADMLAGRRIAGCENACWMPEDQGKSSRRTQMQSYTPYDSTEQIPKTLSLILSTTCNLTCSYCCKEFSSSWLRDLDINGDYDIRGHGDRYRMGNKDLVLKQVSQKTMDSTETSKLIQQQIANNIDGIEQIVISGGEPLLYHDIETILQTFGQKKIRVFSGLGFPSARLEKLIPLIKEAQATMVISAENTGQFHEFNRYGITYDQFLHNLNLVQTSDISLSFQSSISNLTVFDFPNFVDAHPDTDVVVNFVYEPDFFNPGFIDPKSKDILKETVYNNDSKWAKEILPTLDAEPTVEQKQNLKNFVKRFASARNLDIEIYPKTFLDWLEQ